MEHNKNHAGKKAGCNSAIEGTGLTIKGLVEDYLIEHLVREATADTYWKVARRWEAETHITTIEAITREAVITWRGAILGRARPETWNKYRRHMRALLNHALGRGWCEVNQFKEVPPAHTGHRLKKTVDTDIVSQALQLLEQGDLDRVILNPAWFWAMVIRAYYFTGVRRRQLVGLQWRDIDLEQGTWLVRSETSKTRREWVLPIAPEVIHDLETLKDRTVDRLNGSTAPNHQVFNVTLFYPRYKGAFMNADQVSGFFQRLSNILGEKITPHRLRHTMATLLAAHGDVRTLQELLGHTNISTTMGYVHPDVERLRSLVSRLPVL